MRDVKKSFDELSMGVTESQNCLVLPAPHKRASRPPPDFTVLFYINKTILETLVGNGFLNKYYIN